MKTLFNTIFLLISLTGLSQDLDRIEDLRGDWKFNIGDNPRWSRADYDDSDWEEIFVPSRWEDEGFAGFDGYAWYRRDFELKNNSQSNLVLVLGFIDDADEVFFNGELIGFSGSFPPKFSTAFDAHREYTIPKHLVNRNGKNTIAVRVYDTVLDGGMIKGKVGIYSSYEIPANTLVLEGVWKIRSGDNSQWKNPDYDDTNWQNIMVPSFIRNMKTSFFDDIVWYRKEFALPADLRDEQALMMILGKIDDFDETYLNGVLIGETNDGRMYGVSNSYDENRIYAIPAGVINRNGINVISVRVKDIRSDVGIYRGPIGIVPYANHRHILKSRQ